LGRRTADDGHSPGAPPMMPMMMHWRTPAAAIGSVLVALMASEARVQEKWPNNELYYAEKSWGQSYRDQWAHWKIGLTPKGDNSAWDIEDGSSNPVTIAFVDTGLDYMHPKIARENIWVNTREIASNGRDDDDNGYVDDVIGWNFVDRNNNPWDEDGHGTFTAGMIAATIGDGQGIAGINRGVRIMPLKALNVMGRGMISTMVPAIIYAANNGARIINISIEQIETDQSQALQWAVDYAFKKGALVVVAAGNQGQDTATISPSGLKHIIAVAGTDTADKRMGFSNWGKGIRLSAPAEEILSLRARRTDLLLMAGTRDYKRGRSFLGADSKYYHATGTSFSAPFVSGVASLILARNPSLTPVQLEHMLTMSADDVEAPGWDRLTGYGRLNARKALQADPDYFLYCEIHTVAPARVDGKPVVQITGRVDGGTLDRFEVQLGEGETPTSWKSLITRRGERVEDGVIATFPLSEINKRGHWAVRLVAYDRENKMRESRGALNVQ
jgi:subtilisin family serine protease